MANINFEFDTPYGKFSDALWFAEDQGPPSDADIETMKQQRLDNWIAVITAPPVDEPTDADIGAIEQQWRANWIVAGIAPPVDEPTE
jgi:hypothetical protein